MRHATAGTTWPPAPRYRIAYIPLTLFGWGLDVLRSPAEGPLFVPTLIYVGLGIVWLVRVLQLVLRIRAELAADDLTLRAAAAGPWQFSMKALLVLPVALWLLLAACFPS